MGHCCVVLLLLFCWVLGAWGCYVVFLAGVFGGWANFISFPFLFLPVLRVLHTLRPVRRVATRHRARRTLRPLRCTRRTGAALVELRLPAHRSLQTLLILTVEAMCHPILQTTVAPTLLRLLKRAAREEVGVTAQSRQTSTSKITETGPSFLFFAAGFLWTDSKGRGKSYSIIAAC